MHATMSEANGRRRLALAVIFATILIDFIGYSILIPVLPRFEKTLGASAFEIGLITSLYALGLVLFLPLWGWMSDRVGRRPVLLASLLGTTFSFLWLAFADSLASVMLARLVGGFFGASIGTAQAYVTDLTAEHERAQGMGVIGAASGAGLVLGTALGGVLGAVDPNLPFYATAAVAALNFVLAAFALPESKTRVPTDTGVRGLLRVLIPAPLLVMASVHGRPQRLYLFLFLQIFFAFSAVEAMFPLFAAARFGWGEMQTGLYMAGVCIVLGASQVGLVGRLSREWGEPTMTTIGLGLLALSLAGLSFADSFLTLTPCALGVALGGGLAFPAFTSLFSKACGAHEAGEYMSQSQAMVHTGRTLGALCWGWVFASFGAGAPFLLAGAALLGALALFLGRSRVLLPQA
jgi:MFS family permease